LFACLNRFSQLRAATNSLVVAMVNQKTIVIFMTIPRQHHYSFVRVPAMSACASLIKKLPHVS
jgi:hypothetical protein